MKKRLKALGNKRLFHTIFMEHAEEEGITIDDEGNII